MPALEGKVEDAIKDTLRSVDFDSASYFWSTVEWNLGSVGSSRIMSLIESATKSAFKGYPIPPQERHVNPRSADEDEVGYFKLKSELDATNRKLRALELQVLQREKDAAKTKAAAEKKRQEEAEAVEKRKQKEAKAIAAAKQHEAKKAAALSWGGAVGTDKLIVSSTCVREIKHGDKVKALELLDLEEGGVLVSSGKTKVHLWKPTGESMRSIDLFEGKLSPLNEAILSIQLSSLGICMEAKEVSISAITRGRIAAAEVLGGTSYAEVWDTSTGTRACDHSQQSHRSGTCVAALPGDLVASADYENNSCKIYIWDATTGKDVATANTSFICRSLAVLPDGRMACGCRGAIHLLNTSTLDVTARLNHDLLDSYVKTLVVLEGGLLASGCEKRVYLWNTLTEDRVGLLVGHTNDVTSLAVLPRGLLASGSDDNTVRVWDVASNACLTVLSGHTRGLVTLPDGCLASGGTGDTIRIWKLSGAERRPATAPVTVGPLCPTCHNHTAVGAKMQGKVFHLCVFCRHVLPEAAEFPALAEKARKEEVKRLLAEIERKNRLKEEEEARLEKARLAEEARLENERLAREKAELAKRARAELEAAESILLAADITALASEDPSNARSAAERAREVRHGSRDKYVAAGVVPALIASLSRQAIHLDMDTLNEIDYLAACESICLSLRFFICGDDISTNRLMAYECVKGGGLHPLVTYIVSSWSNDITAFVVLHQIVKVGGSSDILYAYEKAVAPHVIAYQCKLKYLDLSYAGVAFDLMRQLQPPLYSDSLTWDSKIVLHFVVAALKTTSDNPSSPQALQSCAFLCSKFGDPKHASALIASGCITILSFFLEKHKENMKHSERRVLQNWTENWVENPIDRIPAFLSHLGFLETGFRDRANCALCGAKFGIFLWRHHCQFCRELVCTGCKTERRRKDVLGREKRACEKCF